MANVPTHEVEDSHEEPISSTAIREAILERIPEDENILRDIRIHDGLADISIKWRTLRWSTSMAIQGMSADEVADKVEAMFKTWVDHTINSHMETPKYEMVIRHMKGWVRSGKLEGVFNA